MPQTVRVSLLSTNHIQASIKTFCRCALYKSCKCGGHGSSPDYAWEPHYENLTTDCDATMTVAVPRYKRFLQLISCEVARNSKQLRIKWKT